MSEKGTDLYKLIGSNIKNLRKQNKLGQEDLAGLISLSRSSLSNIEIGKHQPSIFTIYEISNALNCNLGDILPSTEDYKALTQNVDEKFEGILKKYSDDINLSTKDIIILKGVLNEDDQE
jgi:transcriptional regulator with XRE-family HTH domain